MRGPFEFVARSRLDAPAATVLESMLTVSGVNYELRPIVRMTAPRGTDRLDPASVPTGERLFRSWILLFGLIPIDYDDITVVRLDPARGFLERSPMASQRLWEHERLVEPDGDGCVVTDRVLHEPKIALGGRLQSAVFRQVFLHRHRRLRKRFGAR